MNVTELINLLESMPDDAIVAIVGKPWTADHGHQDGPFELKAVEYDGSTDAVVLSV